MKDVALQHHDNGGAARPVQKSQTAAGIAIVWCRCFHDLLT
jgi:hypothetical protein